MAVRLVVGEDQVREHGGREYGWHRHGSVLLSFSVRRVGKQLPQGRVHTFGEELTQVFEGA
jgi:hypothetical protein